jgi:C4-dicarboxylate-specific signal transduction histidine kinase
MGLTMSKEMIEKDFNGELCVRNFKEGTCFEIRLKA